MNILFFLKPKGELAYIYDDCSLRQGLEKLERSGFHVTRSEFVDAPVIDELPLVLECRLVSYDPNTHFMVGEIVNAGADEAILDDAGMIDPAKLKPLTFDPANGAYWSLGEKAGNACLPELVLNLLPVRFTVQQSFVIDIRDINKID